MDWSNTTPARVYATFKAAAKKGAAKPKASGPGVAAAAALPSEFDNDRLPSQPDPDPSPGALQMRDVAEGPSEVPESPHSLPSQPSSAKSAFGGAPSLEAKGSGKKVLKRPASAKKPGSNMKRPASAPAMAARSSAARSPADAVEGGPLGEGDSAAGREQPLGPEGLVVATRGPRGGTTVHLAPDITLGCAKCRKQRTGCAVCRRANGLIFHEGKWIHPRYIQDRPAEGVDA